jgi:sugar lactone lactonase YvrE
MRYLRFLDNLALAAPRGLTVDGARLLVADSGNHRIASIDAAAPSGVSDVLGGTAALGPSLLFPTSAIVPAADELVVVDAGHYRLHRYARAGGVLQFSTTIDPFSTLAPAGELIDAASDGGALLLLDRTNRRILRFDRATASVVTHLTDATWVAPSALAVGGGYLWVADARRHTLDRYDAALQRQTFGRFGRNPGELSEPNGVLFDASSGSVYVSEGAGGRVSRFDVAGQFLESCNVPIGSRRPSKMALWNGILFVADEAANGVHLIDAAAVAEASAGPFPTRLDFESVLVGATDSLIVQLRNPSSRDVTFTEVGLIGEGFTIEPTPVTPILVAAGTHHELTVRFSPQVAGLRAGDLRIISTDDTAPVGLVRLIGTGVEARPSAVVLVLDTSGSMAQSSGSISKIERLQNACAVFLDLLSLRPGGDLSIIRFSTHATVELALAQVTPTLLQTASDRIAALTPGGSTAIGAGLERAFTELMPSLLPARHVIVLTDGRQNVPPSIDAVERPPLVRTYAVGLGLTDNIDAEVLSALASASGGYLQTTDGQDELLPKFFLQILTDISGDQTLLDPTFKPRAGKTTEFRFHVSDEERELRALVAWNDADTRLDMTWVTPSGLELRAERGVVRRRGTHLIASLRLRGRPWNIPGEWRARVRCLKAARGDVAVLAITTASNLQIELHTRVTPHSLRKGQPPRAVEPVHGSRDGVGGLSTPTPALPELCLGDDLIVALRLGRSTNRAQIAGGHLTWWQPRSPRSAVRPDASRDADGRKEGDGRQGLRRARRIALRRIEKSSTVGCSFALDGPDGVHRLDIAVLVRSAGGHLTQRERTIYVLVKPKHAGT